MNMKQVGITGSYKGKKYQIGSGAGEKAFEALHAHRMPFQTMKNSSSGMEYVDNETYFVFRKIDGYFANNFQSGA